MMDAESCLVMQNISATISSTLSPWELLHHEMVHAHMQGCITMSAAHCSFSHHSSILEYTRQVQKYSADQQKRRHTHNQLLLIRESQSQANEQAAWCFVKDIYLV